MSHWNYRICHFPKQGIYAVKEVYYDDEGKPRAYADAEILGDDEAEVRQSISYVQAALEHPVFEVPLGWQT